MNFYLLVALGIVLALIITRYSAQKVMMLQYPFLISIVLTGWVFPQLVGIYVSETVPADALTKTIIYIILCLLFAIWGYNSTRKTYKMAGWKYSQTKLQIAAALLMVLGAFFYARFSALAAEATELYGGFWTGRITIYVFLSSMLTVGFVLAIGSFLQKPTLLNRAMIAFGIGMFLQRVLIYGRREAAIELFLIFILFLWRKYGWVPSRWAFFGMLVAGMLFITGVGAYRNLMIATDFYGWSGAAFSEVLSIDFLGIFIGNFTSPHANQELQNAALTITAADIRLSFDGGMSIWNRFVFSFVPGQIIGHDIKQGLIFSFPNVALEEFNHVPWPGTTYTGFADSFRSFWFFGALVFFAIGSIMRSWFISVERGSVTALMVLMLISSQSLIAVTHNSYDFFLVFVNLTVFMFPALLFSRTSRVGLAPTQTMR